MSNSTPLLTKKKFAISGKVELFPQKKGWHYVGVPKKYTNETKHLLDRGLVAITAKVGSSSWKTSFLPMGDGTHFIALPVKVRNKEKVELNDSIKLSFVLRER